MSAATVISSVHMKTQEGQLRPIRPKIQTYEVQASIPTTSIANIVNSTLDYDFRINPHTVWLPRQSYFRYRVKVSKAGGGSLEQAHLAVGVADDEVSGDPKLSQSIAFAADDASKEYSHALSFNAGSTPFQQMTLQLGGSPVDTTNNVAIVDSAIKRLQYNGMTADALSGGDAISGSYLTRQQAISSQVEWEQDSLSLIKQPFALTRQTFADGSAEYEFCYTPSFSYWTKDACPPGDYRLSCLTVTEDQLKNSFLTALSDPASVDLAIDMKFFISTQKTAQDADRVLLELDVVDYQAKDIVQVEGENAFDVKSSCHTILTGFQGSLNNSGKSLTHPITQLIVEDSVAADLDPIKPNNKYWLKDFYIEHNGEIQPVNHYRCASQDSSHQLYRQIYLDNQIKLGNLLVGRCSESFGDFMYLGPMMVFNIESGDCPPRVNTYYSLNKTGSDNCKQLLIQLSRAVCEIKYSNGKVASVRTVLR